MQKKFDNRLCTILREAGLLPPSAVYPPRLLLAVSGGIDSMCMAELFLHSSVDVNFAIAHCNFHLRAEESDSDASLVAAWGERNGILVYVNNFDTAGYAAEKGISIEMAARELRYGWFSHICEEDGFDAVVTAHHADDNAETMLLNLVRGTGLKGLCGMSEISANPYSDNGGLPLLRPLLGFTRDQIEGYVLSHGVDYNEDSTNADSAYKRNLIRNEIMPLLKRLNPSVVKTLSREMKYFSQAWDIVENHCSGGVKVENNAIDIAQLTGQGHWEYRLYMLLERYGFNSSTVAAIEDLIKSGRTFPGKCFSSDTHRIVTAAGRLIISRRTDAQAEYEETVISGEGEYTVGGKVLNVEIMPRDEIQNLVPPEGALYFDADALPFPFVCRKWRDGDYLQPFGMKGRKKISDLFTDLKYSLPQKQEALMIASDSDGSHVLALLGERIDEGVKIKSESKNVLVLRFL